MGLFAHADALVFAQADRKPQHGHNITRRDLREVLKRAKVPRIRSHDAHVLPHMQEEAAPQLEARLLGTVVHAQDSRG